MRNIKYGLLVILSIILFSVPALAAQKTYYLPSKIVDVDSNIKNVLGLSDTYIEYAYDKYGHMTKRLEHEDDRVFTYTWKYKYDKKGKRTSGEYYNQGDFTCKLYFDKKDRLAKKVLWNGSKSRFIWNSKGYFDSKISLDDPNKYISYETPPTYKYYFDSNGKLIKRGEYTNGKLEWVSYYDKSGDKSGLISKSVSKEDGFTFIYKYEFDKNGLVTTIKVSYIDEAGNESSFGTSKIYYSKTKTNFQTYCTFINGFRTCENNGLL